jgi:hypothetical protein
MAEREEDRQRETIVRGGAGYGEESRSAPEREDVGKDVLTLTFE